MASPQPSSPQFFLEKFVSTHYGSQPRPVRIVVFVVFAALLALTIYRTTLGEHTIHGRILQRTARGYAPAQLIEVEFGQRSFGTNSKGLYYLVLSPAQYYGALASGDLELELSRGTNIFPSQRVKFGRVKQRLADIMLDSIAAPPADAPVGLGRGPAPRPAARASLFDLVLSPLSAQTAQPTERLFVNSIRLSRSAKLRQATLEMTGIDAPIGRRLMWARTGNVAGQVPVLPGETIAFDAGYWLPWVQPAGADTARITLQGGGGLRNAFLGRHSERFTIASVPAPGQPFTVTGDQGSELTLVRMLPYNLVVFDKDDLAGIRDGLRQDLSGAGLFVSVGTSPLGAKGQTNALFGGAGVPFTTLQTVLKAAVDRGVTFKTIEYRRTLISGNPHEIQLGGSAAFNTHPPIPAATIQELLRATTEAEFTGVLARLTRSGPGA